MNFTELIAGVYSVLHNALYTAKYKRAQKVARLEKPNYLFRQEMEELSISMKIIEAYVITGTNCVTEEDIIKAKYDLISEDDINVVDVDVKDNKLVCGVTDIEFEYLSINEELVKNCIALLRGHAEFYTIYKTFSKEETTLIEKSLDKIEKKLPVAVRLYCSR